MDASFVLSICLGCFPWGPYRLVFCQSKPDIMHSIILIIDVFYTILLLGADSLFNNFRELLKYITNGILPSTDIYLCIGV